MHITDAVAIFSEGGVHDYYSNGDYWHSNQDKSDGLPYVLRDGESNPNYGSKKEIFHNMGMFYRIFYSY